MNKALAILFKYPNADPVDDFRVREAEGVQVLQFWRVTDEAGNLLPQPTEEEIALWWNDYETWAEQKGYRDLRREAYPEVGDQLDAIWKAWTPPTGTEAAEMRARIMAVKNQYPKPNL